MTDITPVPQAEPPAGIPTLSVEQILALEKRLRENKAAAERGDPLPHIVEPDEMRAAVQSIKRMRGTMNLAGTSGAGKSKSSGGKSKIELLDLDGL